MGFQLIAVSPDKPEKEKLTRDKHGLQYTLLSDSGMTGARALGIAYRLDDATVKMYREQYHIDIEGDSGQTHHLLPVPAVFLVDTDGTITFHYVNPNYQVRVDPDVILAAARSLAMGKQAKAGSPAN